MKNKKLLIGGASALSLATLGLGAFAFFTDTVELNKDTKVGTVDLEGTIEMKHTQLKRDRIVSDIYSPYAPDADDFVTYPAFPGYNFQFGTGDVDVVQNAAQVLDTFETAPDNLNPGDNLGLEEHENRFPGTDHEIIVNVTNEGSKSVQTRMIFELTGTAADGVTPLTAEQLSNIKIYFDPFNSHSGLTSAAGTIIAPNILCQNRIRLNPVSEENQSENKLMYGFSSNDIEYLNFPDFSNTDFGKSMLGPFNEALSSDLVFSGNEKHQNREIEAAIKYLITEINESGSRWDVYWEGDSEEINAPTSATFKFDVAMNLGMDFYFDEDEGAGHYEDINLDEIAALEGANINIKVIVQGMQYRNTGEPIWDTMFEQEFTRPI